MKDMLKTVLSALLLIAACADIPDDFPEEDIANSSQESLCVPETPSYIQAQMGPAGWKYAAQLLIKTSGPTCLGAGDSAKYDYVGTNGKFTIVSDQGYQQGCGGATSFGIWCDNQWRACPDLTLSEAKLTNAYVVRAAGGYNVVPWSTMPASFWLSPIITGYTGPAHWPTTAFYTSSGSAPGWHVECNYNGQAGVTLRN